MHPKHRKLRARIVTVLTTTLIGTTLPAVAPAQDYPTKPIDWIVMWSAGGGADTATRIFTNQLEQRLDEEIVVKNVTGGGGSLGYIEARSADSDGYTLVTLQGDLPKFEPLELAPIAIDDFDVIAGFAYQSPIIVTHADAPWDTLEEFMEDARNNPGEYSAAITDIGGVFHQPLLLWEQEANFDVSTVTEEGSEQQAVSVLGRHTDIAVTWVKATASQVNEGELKYLGYMSSEPHPDYPDVPTLTSLGYDVVWEHPYGVGAPAGIPQEAKDTIETAAKEIWADPEFVEDLKNVGLSVLKRDAKEYREHLQNMQDNMTEALKLIEE